MKQTSTTATLTSTLAILLTTALLLPSMANGQDLAALTTLVQQQAATIQTLQSEVAVLKAAMVVVQGNQTAVLNDKVAFSAHTSRIHIPVDDTPIVFNIALTNEGSGYDETTGIFTAPYHGTYVFHFLVVNDEHSPFIQVALVQGNGLPGFNGRVLAVGTADGGPNNSYDDASSLVAVKLFPGNQVFVKRNLGAHSIYGDAFCSFSGFMLTEG